MSDEDEQGEYLGPCSYGDKCYRKNPEHFKLYSHPRTISRSDTWPSTPPSTSYASSLSSFALKVPNSAPASLHTSSSSSIPYVDLADDTEVEHANKKRKIEEGIQIKYIFKFIY